MYENRAQQPETPAYESSLLNTLGFFFAEDYRNILKPDLEYIHSENVAILILTFRSIEYLNFKYINTNWHFVC